MTTESLSTSTVGLARDPIAARTVAEELYRGEGLALPDLPPDLDGNWHQEAPTIFANAPLGEHASLYALEQILGEIFSRRLPTPFVAFGFDGHGLASQAVHLDCATAQVIVLIQIRWGTILDDPAAARKSYAAYLKSARRILDLSAAAAAKGTFPKNQRLAVIHSSFTGSRWSWLPAAPSPAPIDWHNSPDLAVFEAIKELQKLG